MSPEPMTERFEMRLSETVLERLDAWRAQQADLPSRSEAVRRLVEEGLYAREGRRPVKILDGEKLTLIMLCELFRQLKLKGDIEPRFLEEVIYGGHYWALEWRYPGIFHGHEASTTVLTEVVDILDMWSFLEDGFNDLSKTEKAHVAEEAEPLGKQVVFAGFDGNNESEYISIARFLIEKLDRFSEFKGRTLDAHMPTIEAHRRMLTIFEPIRPRLVGRKLNASEVIDILKAMIHPSRRKTR